MSVTINIGSVTGAGSPQAGSSGDWRDAASTMVNFLVGVGNNQDTFRGDRRTLASLSPEFAKMVSGANATFDTGYWISLPDDDPVAFKNVMNFVENGSARPTKENAVKTFSLARKYKVPQVAKECREFIKTTIRAGGVGFAVEVIEMARKMNDEELKIAAEEYLIPRFSLLIKSPAFYKLSYTSVCEYLQDESVVVISELELFQACLNWAKNECKKKGLDPNDIFAVKGILSDIRQLIRYPVISLKEFTEKVQPLRILEPQDVELLHVYWDLRENDPISAQEMGLPFLKTKRTGPLSYATFFSRKPSSSSTWVVNRDQWFAIRIWSEYTIKIHNIMLYGQPADDKKSGKVSIKLMVKSLSTNAGGTYVLKEAHNARMVMMPENNVRIEFERPLHIEAGEKYELRLRFLGWGTVDNSRGSMMGTGWKSVIVHTQTLASTNRSILIKVKKVEVDDCLFHTMTFTVIRFLNNKDVLHVQHTEKPEPSDACTIM